MPCENPKTRIPSFSTESLHDPHATSSRQKKNTNMTIANLLKTKNQGSREPLHKNKKKLAKATMRSEQMRWCYSVPTFPRKSIWANTNRTIQRIHHVSARALNTSSKISNPKPQRFQESGRCFPAQTTHCCAAALSSPRRSLVKASQFGAPSVELNSKVLEIKDYLEMSSLSCMVLGAAGLGVWNLGVLKITIRGARFGVQ